jgi:hypothetical protein
LEDIFGWLTFPVAYCGPSAFGNKNGALMPPQFENAIVTPVARAVAVEPDTVAVRWAKNGMTAAFVQAIKNTAT